jgi:hypothetical protein
MAKFLVVHSVGKGLTLESAKPVAKAAKAHSSADAYWVRSWYARDEGKLYCEWDGKDAQTVRSMIKKAAPDLPVDGVYKMDMMVNGEDFR